MTKAKATKTVEKPDFSSELHQMIKVKLYLRNIPDVDNLCRVYAYVYVNNQKGYLDTGIKVQASDWDPKDRLVKSSHPKCNDFNLILKQSLARVNEIAINYRLSEKQLSFKLLQKAFFADEGSLNFISWCRKDIDKREHEMVAAATMALHHSVLNKFAEFCNGNMPFFEIDERTLATFEKWLRVKKSNSINTVHKNMKVLRLYFNRAIREGLMKQTPFGTFKMKKEKSQPDCLSESELNKAFEIYRSNRLTEERQSVLRVFLFGCCTGLRISDLKRLTWSNVMGKTLVFSMYKTRNTAPIMVKVPLTNTAFRLMRDAGSSRGIIFETPENDSYANKVLKHALSAMNVADKIHFHTARHTFATHYLRKNKGDIVTLKTLMGHSKIEQTMVYLTVDEDWLHEGMANFGEWI